MILYIVIIMIFKNVLRYANSCDTIRVVGSRDSHLVFVLFLQVLSHPGNIKVQNDTQLDLSFFMLQKYLS